MRFPCEILGEDLLRGRDDGTYYPFDFSPGGSTQPGWHIGDRTSDADKEDSSPNRLSSKSTASIGRRRPRQTDTPCCVEQTCGQKHYDLSLTKLKLEAYLASLGYENSKLIFPLANELAEYIGLLGKVYRIDKPGAYLPPVPFIRLARHLRRTL
jgi:hypothetical protein